MSVFPPGGNRLALRWASSRAQLTTYALKIAAVASHQHPRKSLWREGDIYVQPRELRGIHVHCNEILSSLVLCAHLIPLHPSFLSFLWSLDILYHLLLCLLLHPTFQKSSFLFILVYHCTFPPFLSCCLVFYPRSCHTPPPPLFGDRIWKQKLNCILTHFMFISS